MPEGYYVKSVRLRDKEMKDRLMDTTRGAEGPLVITISSKAGWIDGVVRNAKQEPVGSATVVLAPDSRARDESYQEVITDQNGRFVIKSIEPGDYKLFAWETAPDDYMDPEVLKPMERFAFVTHIREGSWENVDLKIIGAN
jgi:hypothetical protein